MKKSFLVSFSFLIGLIVFLLVRSQGYVKEEDISSSNNYAPNEVLVKFKEGTEDTIIKAALGSINGNIISYLNFIIPAPELDLSTSSNLSFLKDPLLFHVKVPDSIGTEKAISLLKQNPLIEYAEPNYRVYSFTDDEYYSLQWGLDKIDAPEAWDIFTGSSDITVAVVDTGVDYEHEDLAENLWINPGEYGDGKENDGQDNDGNGYKDDYRGWNFCSGNNNVMDYDSPRYHGTHIAGIIGALANNGHGIAGVCWNIKIMPLRSDGYVAYCIPAIDYAVDMGAKGINASWGFADYSQSLYSAIQRARLRGVLVVAAAGNRQPPIDWDNNDSNPVYPASFNLDNVIAVLSTDHNDLLSSFSHYGKTSVDIGAPGGSGDSISPDIISTKYHNAYQYLYGTSQAAPHVLGVAALVWGLCPEMSPSQMRARLIEKADYIPNLYDKCVANGRVNAYKAVYDNAGPPNGTPAIFIYFPCSWKSVNLGWYDNSTNEIGFNIRRKKSGEPEFTGIASVDANITGYTDGLLYGGTVEYKVRVYNMAGNLTSTFVSVSIPSGAPPAPSNLATEGPTLVNFVMLNWNDNATNEQAFIVQRRRSGGGIWTNVATLEPVLYEQYPTMTWTDKNVSQGNYYYRVIATNPNGNSYSNQIYVEVEWP